MTSYAHDGIDWNGNYECPVCHSDNIDTDDSGPEDDYYYYDMHCNDCDAIFRQWYRMVPSDVSYSTKEEQEQHRSVTFTPSMPAPSVPPSALPHVTLRHNYDLAPVSDNPILDVLSQAQADTATRNLLIPRVNWQAINQALNES